MILKELKNDTNNEDSTRIRYVCKLTRVKYSKKCNKLRTEMTPDEKIKKDFWKYCKYIFESKDKVLYDFYVTICYEYFIKSLKKNKHSRDYSPPSRLLIYKKISPKQPFNFRPTTLGPLCAKVLTSLIQNRMYSYLIRNKYIETDIQKGFWTGISGTIEHTETLTYMITLHD